MRRRQGGGATHRKPALHGPARTIPRNTRKGAREIPRAERPSRTGPGSGGRGFGLGRPRLLRLDGGGAARSDLDPPRLHGKTFYTKRAYVKTIA